MPKGFQQTSINLLVFYSFSRNFIYINSAFNLDVALLK